MSQLMEFERSGVFNREILVRSAVTGQKYATIAWLPLFKCWTIKFEDVRLTARMMKEIADHMMEHCP